MFKKIDWFVAKLENIASIGILWIMVITVLLGVLSRYVFATPFSWSEELARWTLIWLTFLGGAIATREKAHFVVDVVVSKLPVKLRAFCQLVLLVFVAVFWGAMAYTGTTMLPIVHRQISTGLNIPMSFIYLAIPIGSVLILYHTLVIMKETLSELQGHYIKRTNGHSGT